MLRCDSDKEGCRVCYLVGLHFWLIGTGRLDPEVPQRRKSKRANREYMDIGSAIFKIRSDLRCKMISTWAGFLFRRRDWSQEVWQKLSKSTSFPFHEIDDIGSPCNWDYFIQEESDKDSVTILGLSSLLVAGFRGEGKIMTTADQYSERFAVMSSGWFLPTWRNKEHQGRQTFQAVQVLKLPPLLGQGPRLWHKMSGAIALAPNSAEQT